MTDPAKDHDGKRYAIVGGTNGMGHAAARLLAAQGAAVALIGRDPARAAAVAAGLAAETGATVHGEGSSDGGAGAAVTHAAARLGGLDGIAVTAGPINSQGTILDLSDADWEEMFETQLMTTVRAVRAAIPLLAAGGGGTIVTTSAYSLHAQKAVLPHYTAMKAAIASLTKNIAKHQAAAGIRANCIAPGAIATEALDSARDAARAAFPDLPADTALSRFMMESWSMKVALERVGQPHEVGELIAFLLSPRAAYLTGALINIDGGTDF